MTEHPRSPTVMADEAMLKLKAITGLLRQLGANPWGGIDENLPAACGYLGQELQSIHDDIGRLYPCLLKGERQ